MIKKIGQTGSSNMMIIVGLLVAAAIIGTVVLLSGNDSSDPAQNSNDTVQELVGNPDLNTDALTEDVNNSLNDINDVTSSTADCSTDRFSVAVPANWSCRKLDSSPQDVTLHTDSNSLTFSIGLNQGNSACSIIPTCASESFELNGFMDVTQYTIPNTDTVEIVGTYESDGAIKALVTSNDAISESELADIQAIADSISL